MSSGYAARAPRSNHSDAPDDEMASNHSGSASASASASASSHGHGHMQDEYTNETPIKRKTRDRPWKKSKEYDSIQTDELNVIGVQDDADGISVDADDDHDDDVSYDEPEPTKGSTKVNVNTADILGTEDVSSRWSKELAPSSEEVQNAHDRAVSLAMERARQKEYESMVEKDDVSVASRRSDSSRKSSHQQVRMEALKLLEIANGSSSSRDVRGAMQNQENSGGSANGGGSRLQQVVREKSSALRGIGLNNARQRKNYDRLDMSVDGYPSPETTDRSDVFTTNPTDTPIKGELDDIEIQNDSMKSMDVDIEGEKKKTWGSRYSIDRHLRAVHGGLTSEQVLNKMDRDHYNKLNPNTSATNMFKASPHEDDDRWGVENGRKGDKHKNRLWYTWIEAVKEKISTILNRDDATGSHTYGSHRLADHSSPSKSIFTGVAMTKFLDRLSPMSRAKHEGGSASTGFDWNNVNLMGRSNELPNINFSADDDLADSKRNKRRKMFWGAVIALSCVTLFSVIGVSVSRSNKRRQGGGYINVGEEVRFFVTSDVPFNPADETKLSRELDDLNYEDGDFLIHLGDINKASSTLCTFSVYDDAASLLKQSPVPVIVLPGNNDWNECPMPENAFENWMDELNRFEDNFDVEDFPDMPIVKRMSGRSENFEFLHKGVLFIGVHVVDGSIPDEREWTLRDQENLQWVQMQLSLYGPYEYRAIVLLGHAGVTSKDGDFFWPAMKEFEKTDKPVLYLHANDSPGMAYYHPYENYQKFTAVRLEVGSKNAPTQITVGGGSKPFEWEVTEED